MSEIDQSRAVEQCFHSPFWYHLPKKLVRTVPGEEDCGNPRLSSPGFPVFCRRKQENPNTDRNEDETMSYLQVTGLTHGYGDKLLYKNAEFSLYTGEHMGVVGPNGAGKSTFIGILTGEIVPDEGMVSTQPGIRLGYLDQHATVNGADSIREYLKTAFEGLYQTENNMLTCYQRYAETGEESLLTQAAEYQQILEKEDFYQLDTKIEQVASGLGLVSIGMERRFDTLSGGQRAKVILAKLLLGTPDILLLDEPTNFLDQEHVEWLAGFLRSFENAFLVVSHDYRFLQKISNCICDIENGSIRKYHGSYEQFLKQKEHQREEYLRRYQSQQRKIKQEEEYIRRNIAGVNSRIAKGRRKRLERMERIQAPTGSLIKPAVRFLPAPCSAQELLTVKNLEIGYYYPLLRPFHFHVDNGQRILITGFNGIGKSTLLKTLMGWIPPLSGEYHFAESVKPGYYEQELRWEKPEETPLDILANRFPALSAKELRQALARYGLTREHILQPVSTLSGGEQARIKLCLLCLSPCNFLILDEPTNHLDAQSKAALLQALQEFPGSILLVSHEPEFFQNLNARIVRL